MNRQCAWTATGVKRHLRMLAAIFFIGSMFTAWMGAPVTLCVQAQEPAPASGAPSLSENTAENDGGAAESGGDDSTVDHPCQRIRRKMTAALGSWKNRRKVRGLHCGPGRKQRGFRQMVRL